MSSGRGPRACLFSPHNPGVWALSALPSGPVRRRVGYASRRHGRWCSRGVWAGPSQRDARSGPAVFSGLGSLLDCARTGQRARVRVGPGERCRAEEHGGQQARAAAIGASAPHSPAPARTVIVSVATTHATAATNAATTMSASTTRSERCCGSLGPARCCGAWIGLPSVGFRGLGNEPIQRPVRWPRRSGLRGRPVGDRVADRHRRDGHPCATAGRRARGPCGRARARRGPRRRRRRRSRRPRSRGRASSRTARPQTSRRARARSERAAASPARIVDVAGRQLAAAAQHPQLAELRRQAGVFGGERGVAGGAARSRRGSS